ncbi:MAG: hypothetical protein VZR56_12090 [Treponema sp.]|nr:hypothetical protein [Treponema sp.]
MKKLYMLLVLALLPFSIFAGPFGLKMGMTLEELSAACIEEPEYIADDRYYIQPKKSHPLFYGYVAWVSEANGLYYIKGISREIKTTDYGTEVKQEFSKLLSPLEKKYGKFKKIDKLSFDTLWKDPGDWMIAIADGARIYEAHWEATDDNVEKFEGLISIAIGIKTEATYITNEAYIWIEYGFINAISGFEDLDEVL